LVGGRTDSLVCSGSGVVPTPFLSLFKILKINPCHLRIMLLYLLYNKTPTKRDKNEN